MISKFFLAVIAGYSLNVGLKNAAFAASSENRILQGTIEVQTTILPPDPVAGMKSIQYIFVYLDKQARRIIFETKYETGKTFSIPAVRKKFTMENQISNLQQKNFYLDVTGQTATGVGIVPDIDYKFSISFSWKNGRNTWNISGCHDGYPAYKIQFFNAISSKTLTLYEFRHDPVDLLKLFGTCDVKVNKKIDNED